MRRRVWAALAVAALLVAALGSAGCSTVGYLTQSVQGHLALMQAARPVQDWLDDPATPAGLRERLLLTQRLRDYAVAELALPDNDSYRRYADLKRPAAVWNVVAAPPLSLKLENHCFPVVGCVGYRGYFALADAQAEAERQRARGLEVAVYPVPAYSTLGWTNWFGGDPLLNTFLGLPEGELARLLFHELAHQVVYAAGDTPFNESFATTVERLGGERWLRTRAGETAREDYARYDGRRRQFRALAREARAALQAVYESERPDPEKLTAKAEVFARLRAQHQALKAGEWRGFAGYDAWFERANNASLAVLGAYDDQVPRFERLFHREGGDFKRFYAEVKRLADLPRPAREKAMQALDDAAVTSTTR
jgi:predicted aminopeptidase